MAISLTPAQLEALDPCDLGERLALFGRRKKMTAKQALAAGATVSELLWVAGRLGLKEQCVRFALACAQRVAHGSRAFDRRAGRRILDILDGED